MFWGTRGKTKKGGSGPKIGHNFASVSVVCFKKTVKPGCAAEPFSLMQQVCRRAQPRPLDPAPISPYFDLETQQRWTKSGCRAPSFESVRSMTSGLLTKLANA